MSQYIQRQRQSALMDRKEKSRQMLDRYPSGLYPRNKSLSDKRATNYFDVGSARDLSPQDINNASNLLGIGNELSSSGGPNSWGTYDDEGHMDRALRKIVDAPYHRNSVDYKRESAPANTSLLDPLYSASSALRDGVKSVAPGVVDAIDGADAWLFDKTGGLLGTPKNIKPKHQLQLRKGFRDELEFDREWADGLGIGYGPERAAK